MKTETKIKEMSGLWVRLENFEPTLDDTATVFSSQIDAFCWKGVVEELYPNTKFFLVKNRFPEEAA